jgi:hypothetical protein
MKTIVTLFIITLTLSSCKIDLNKVRGNGQVTTQERTITEPFNKIKGARGLHVIISQGADTKVKIEADENLHDYITTTVNNGTLIVTSTENIGRASAKNIYITTPDINEISASSGADINAKNTITSQHLALTASSGANISLDVFSKDLELDCSSGADMDVSGKTKTLLASASSGSDIDAKDLIASEGTIKVSSGADITVHVLQKIEASASSGGAINYYGTPIEKTIKKSSGGSIKAKE